MIKKFVSYIKNSLKELEKMKFPEKKEVISISIIILISTFVFGFIFYGIDLLSWLIFNKIIIGL